MVRIALLMTLALSGCATGVPVGGQTPLHRATYRPFAPAVAPRARPAAGPAILRAEPTRLADPEGARVKLVETARGLIGRRGLEVDGRSFPDDCTGLVRAAYAKVGIDLMTDVAPGDNGVTAIHRLVQRRGQLFKGGWPRPGDLVFFHDTYDQNRDGRRNDGLTHVALVDGVDGDGTVRIIHRVGRGVVRYRMNLDHPGSRRHPETGVRINDYLRGAGGGRPAKLSSQLFAGYATLVAPAEAHARR